MSARYWIPVVALAEVAERPVVPVHVDGHDLALFQVDGQWHATDNQCSHGSAWLSEGCLLGHEVECPLHQGRFDVRTGEPTEGPACEALRCYPVRVDERQWIQVELG